VPNVQPPLSDGFRLGEFSDVELSKWLGDVSRYGPSDPREARVTNISWWSSHQAPWHHQFITVTVTQDTGDLTSHSYTLKFERLGKLVGQEGTAKQQITIQNLVPLESFLIHSDLICALVTSPFVADSILSQEIPHGCDPVPLTAQPATFGDVVTYMGMIVDKIPNYHVGKDNCYFFSRMLFHVMVLRHYATFNFLSAPMLNPPSNEKSSPPDSLSSPEVALTQPASHSDAAKPLDPVWENLMEILKEREEKEGLLFYEKQLTAWAIIGAIAFITMPASGVGGWFLGSYLHTVGKGWGRFFGILLALMMHFIFFANLDIRPKQHMSSLKEEMLRKTEAIISLHVTSAATMDPA
jgi:hypothetical protein